MDFNNKIINMSLENRLIFDSCSIKIVYGIENRNKTWKIIV